MADKSKEEILREYEFELLMNEIIGEMGVSGSLNPTQLSILLSKPIGTIEETLERLEKARLVESKVGDYYHLTYEGERRFKAQLGKKGILPP